MQHDKDINKNSELENIIKNSEKITSSLSDVMKHFNLKSHFQIFDFLKCKGIAISSLLSILMILPFYGVANIYQLVKCGIKKDDIEGKKTTFYDTLNNENINWRKLLMLHVKRFIYLINNNINLKSTKTTAIIFDDTIITKTGKKIEKVSYVHDHVSHRYILGYKLLVCGFWDGESFVPIDFSLHRERGKRDKKVKKEFFKIKKKLHKQELELSKLNSQIDKNNARLEVFQQKNAVKTNKINTLKINNLSEKIISKQKQKEDLQKSIATTKTQKTSAYKRFKREYLTGKLYGLTPKERKEQFKKAVSTKSHGFTRRKEANKGKIDCMLGMLSRAVKAGIVPNYVLVDSWFFCYELLEKLQLLKKGAIKLIAMVRIHNQKYTICQTDKELPVKVIINNHYRSARKCKKFNAQYFCVKSWYKGIRINLFFVKMGRCNKWHLLATTNLSLSFVNLMEIYQIRWSIEVFFKESKQFLGLSNCSSNTFDAQIAHLTIVMMQHIMLSFYKRINYQQSIGGLFQAISHEMVELDLVTRLLNMFIEIMKIICTCKGIDFIEFQADMIKNEEIQLKIQKMLPDKVLQKTE